MADLFDMVIAEAQLSEGVDPRHVSRISNIPLIVRDRKKRAVNLTTKWTEAEDNYLRKHLGFLSEQEIASHLGRTVTAVHLRWKRDLLLFAPSRHPDYITAHQAAEMLGLDAHKITHWCDAGMIPMRIMPGGRKIRLIYRTSLRRWTVDPNNWIYFDWKRIKDKRLRRMCELRAERWQDEWWDTAQVAKYHGVRTGDVKRLIQRKELPATQLQISRGGRHDNLAWKYWYVKRSDAIKAVFRFGKGMGRVWEPTPRAIEWIKKARALGWGYTDITRSMGSPVTPTTLKNYIIRYLEG